MFEILKDVCLKDFCTFKIGGKAKFLFVATKIEDLIDVCLFAKLHNIKYKIIGLGANLLFDDLGYNGLIIVNKTNKICFALGDPSTPLRMTAKDNSNCHSEQTKCVEESHKRSDKCFVLVDSGVNVTNLIMKCCERSLCGFECLAGIPSTVGGAVVNSLGAFDTSFSDYVEWVECYHKSDLTKKLRLSKDECKFSYRSSLFKCGNYIITKVKLRLFEDDKTLIQKRIKEAVEKKKSTQPLDKPSAGSVFKRSNIIPAKVIDELGLKGTKIGGAEISTKHAGFIVNSNFATSKDVKQLITLIQEKVKSATNEDLTPEIEFVEY